MAKKMKTTSEKLKKELKDLENARKILLRKKIEELEKSDPEIVAIDDRIAGYMKLLKKKEEQEKKLLEIDLEIEDMLQKEEGQREEENSDVLV